MVEQIYTKTNSNSIANGEAEELRVIVPELFDEERMKKKFSVLQGALRWGKRISDREEDTNEGDLVDEMSDQ